MRLPSLPLPGRHLDQFLRMVIDPAQGLQKMVGRFTTAGNSAIVLLIAAGALVGTFVAFLQVHSNVRLAECTREGKSRSMLALLLTVKGKMECGAENSAARRYVELRNEAAMEARDAESRATPPAPAGVQRVERLLAAADAVASRTTALREPYYSPATLGQLKSGGGDASAFFSRLYADLNSGIPDLFAYEAEVGTGRMLLDAEECAAFEEIGRAWARKSGTYQTIIPLIAVALFFYALALTVEGSLKGTFVAFGSLDLFLLTGWAAVVTAFPVPSLRPDAHSAYVEGYDASAVAYEANFWNNYKTAIKKADEAIRSLDRAIDIKPDYAQAYLTRANCHHSKGEALFMTRADPAARDQSLRAAVRDFEKVMELRPELADSYWNCGWVLYLLGDYEGSYERYSEVIRNHPKQQFGARLERVLSTLGMGLKTRALSDTREAIRYAHEHPLRTDIIYFRSTIRLLRRLQKVRPQPGMEEVERLLQESAVSMRYRGTTGPGRTAAVLSRLAFGPAADTRVAPAADGAPFPYGTEQVQVGFDYSGMKNGEQVVLVGFNDDVELPWMTQVRVWSDGPAGQSTRLTIKSEVPEPTLEYFRPGQYDVEVYVEGNLKAQGSFTVDERR